MKTIIVSLFLAVGISLSLQSCSDSSEESVEVENAVKGDLKPSAQLVASAEKFVQTYLLKVGDSHFCRRFVATSRLVQIKDLEYDLLYESDLSKADKMNGIEERFFFHTMLKDDSEPVWRFFDAEAADWSEWMTPFSILNWGMGRLSGLRGMEIPLKRKRRSAYLDLMFSVRFRKVI